MPPPAAAAARALVAVALAAGLAGCGTVSDALPEFRFEALQPSEEAAPEPASRLSEAEIERRPVARVTGLELGATRSGRLLTAYGEAPALGWFQPALRPRAEGRPAPDGFLEFDFLAAPPELNGGEPGAAGTPAQRAVRADRPLSESAFAGAAGIRVFAASGPPAALRLRAEPES